MPIAERRRCDTGKPGEYMTSADSLTERIFDAHGVPVNCALGPASGPPLLLLHGIAERWQTFLPVISLLTPRWQVYALDLRGHGRSGRVRNGYQIVGYARDIDHFLRSDIRQPAVILGHSIGALIAIYLAAAQPQLVKMVVLVDPPLHLQHTPLKAVSNGPYEAFKRIIAILQASGSTQAIERALVEQFPGGEKANHQARAEVLSQLDPGTLASLLEGRHVKGLNLDALLRRMRCPTLLIQGNPKRGAALWDEDVDRALTLLSHGARISIPGGGHMLHHSHPEVIASAVNDFYDLSFGATERQG